ncbi:MAG: GTP cyclohydrolase I FolE [Bacteroidia bacterium]|nr:GTP cyclohydrolase I FolE [Bacteroidia bacterium]MDW8334810.1 GTP cyclohydrolase I FolE [Bacteroidia bacterium]
MEQYLIETVDGTPLRPDAFALSDEEKIEIIAEHFRAIMETLGLDLNDDSLAATPRRVAKMYVKELFDGLDPKNKPVVTLFENRYGYAQMLVEKDIVVHSMCEHHFVPIVGKAHVGYFSTGKVVGLSKINRLVRYYCHRPQVQERLTEQIADALCEALQTPHVGVVVDAKHYCVVMRGVEDVNSRTVTAAYRGDFENPAVKSEFHRLIAGF